MNGKIDLKYSKSNNDFGKGFYCGETYEQSVSFISEFENSSVYLLKLKKEDLKYKTYTLNRDWLMLVAYFRGVLKDITNLRFIEKELIEIENLDYIIAPIVDNRMFEIISLFIEGIITDEQCIHCLVASNLGNQYVLLSKKAVERTEVLERLYISNNERKEILSTKKAEKKINHDKVKLAMIEYKNKGKYIGEY